MIIALLRDAVLSSRTSTKKSRSCVVKSSRIFRGEGIATNRAQSEGRGPLFQNVDEEATILAPYSFKSDF
jgi:hypothetical protein